jgi:hypothetical protein
MTEWIGMKTWMAMVTGRPRSDGLMKKKRDERILTTILLVYSEQDSE